MKAFGVLISLLLMLTASSVAISADAKGKNIDVSPVDVPEKIVVQPTSAEIHMDAPPDQTCTSCHGPNSVDAESKPLTHFLTTKDCGTCHFNKSWIPLRIYNHLSGRYHPKPDVSPTDCAECHVTNTEFQAK